MKIMYVHGFGSTFAEAASSKIESLKTIAEVVGISYDYTAPAKENLDRLSSFAVEQGVDMIVGTSLGGWYTAKLGAALGVPVVLVNPATNPNQSLRTYLGTHEDHYGNTFTMTETACDSYGPFEKNAFGLVLVDLADDVVDPMSVSKENTNYEIVYFEGGSHRFEHMDESLPLIERHYQQAGLQYNK